MGLRPHPTQFSRASAVHGLLSLAPSRWSLDLDRPARFSRIYPALGLTYAVVFAAVVTLGAACLGSSRAGPGGGRVHLVPRYEQALAGELVAADRFGASALLVTGPPLRSCAWPSGLSRSRSRGRLDSAHGPVCVLRLTGAGDPVKVAVTAVQGGLAPSGLRGLT